MLHPKGEVLAGTFASASPRSTTTGCDVRCFYSIGRRDGAFGYDAAGRHQLPQMVGDLGLITSMLGSRWWRHDNVTEAVRFDPALNSGQSRVDQQLAPPAQIKSRLSPLGRKFNHYAGHPAETKGDARWPSTGSVGRHPSYTLPGVGCTQGVR